MFEVLALVVVVGAAVLAVMGRPTPREQALLVERERDRHESWSREPMLMALDPFHEHHRAPKPPQTWLRWWLEVALGFVTILFFGGMLVFGIASCFLPDLLDGP